MSLRSKKSWDANWSASVNLKNQKRENFRQDEPNKQKQEADEDRDPHNVERDGFSAEELGEESAYTDSTEMAQQMRRGDETEPDPKKRDTSAARTTQPIKTRKPKKINSKQPGKHSG